jgi:hypothetical protein
MKTKLQLYSELNFFFSSGQNLLRQINLESFFVPKELIDEINQVSSLSKELKSLMKFQLYLNRFNNKVITYLNDIRKIIFDKIDNPIDVKMKCDFLYKENQNLHYLFKRINSVKFKDEKIKFTKKDFEFLSNTVNAQKIILSTDTVKPIFKLLFDENTNKQKIEESKIDVYRKQIIQKFAFDIYSTISNINSEICTNNVTELGLYYTLEKEGDFVVLSPISKMPKTYKIIKPKPELLIDIWEFDKDGTKDYYNEVIEILQKNFLHIDNAFVINIKNNLHWNLFSKKGSKSYLAGFIHTCVKRKWIIDKYSADEITKILKKTFNLETLDSKTFRSISLFDNQLYIKPFDFLKENK